MILGTQKSLEASLSLGIALRKIHKIALFYKTPFIAIVERIAFIFSVTLIGQLLFSLAKNI